MWNLKYGTNEPIYKSETDSQTENRLAVVKEKWGMNWEFGVSRCKLLHSEWISNKVILYSIGNYVQSLQIRQKRNKGKQYKKENNAIYSNTDVTRDYHVI